MNNGSYIINLGADPESIQLGSTEGMKLRCAEKARGKKAITRWFNAIVTGKDKEVAERLAKGDQLILTGEMALTEYKPKKPRYKGEMVRSDEMPFAKILQVLKSETFFKAADETSSDEPATDAVATDEPSLDGVDPLAGI